MYIHKMPWPPTASWSSQTPPDPWVCVEASGAVLPSSACPFACPYSLFLVYPAPDNNREKQTFTANLKYFGIIWFIVLQILFLAKFWVFFLSTKYSITKKCFQFFLYSSIKKLQKN